MDKKQLLKALDDILFPLSFKRKGNNWVYNGQEISKIINLQQSNYSAAFYINYGYIIHGLPLSTKTHLENRLSSSDIMEQKLITDVLNLENDIDDINRFATLKEIVVRKIVKQMEITNTQHDILNQLKIRAHLNDISLEVKKHFNLI
jgi:hypothetical protein